MFLDLGVGDLMEPLSGRSWDRKRTMEEVARRIARFKELGIGPGDRILVLFGNNLEFFAELLAIWKMGACAVPIDNRLTPFEIHNLAKAAAPKAAVIEDGTPSEVVGPLERSGIKVVETTDISPSEEWANEVSLDQEALILFTSGSTGDPKGVVHTHRSLRARWLSLKENLDIRDFKRSLCVLPTHFGHGLICNCLFPWLSGQDLCVAPPFRPELIMSLGKIIDENGITFLSSVPSIWKMALKLASPPRNGTLRRVHCGSAPLSAHMWKDIKRWCGIEDVCNAYGITETGSWVAGLRRPDVEPQDGLIGEGWGALIKVMRTDETSLGLQKDLECEPEEEGFVWLNTPALMKGYLGREDLTRRCVVDGWFFTGDVGVLDGKGRLVLKGRVRDEINKGGMKIFPSDVDSVVERYSGVIDVCTFAVDDPLYGQNVGMAVVLSDPNERNIAGLYQWMRQHLAQSKMPARWWLLESIPRTSRGKVNREAVKEKCDSLKPLDLSSILARETGE